MIEYIRRYFFARAVCKKYGIKFKQTKKTGYFKFLYDPLDGWIIREIGCSVFDYHFYETLLHELGHYIDYKITGFSDINYRPHKLKVMPANAGHIRFSDVLDREAKASRFALRALKHINKRSDESDKFLSWAIGTYTTIVPREHKADIMYKAQKYIQSKF